MQRIISGIPKVITHLIITSLFLFWTTPPLLAGEYFLAVQPIMSKSRTEEFYRPLASYLSGQTGHRIQILASHNYVSYWEAMRNSGQFDLVLDAAHFTGYRVTKRNYQVLAKIRDTLSFSLITNEDLLLFEPAELIGKRIALPPSPSLAGVQLVQMFPHQMRQPTIIASQNFEMAMQRLKQNRASAALVPTPLISGDVTVNTVTTTDPVPHLAVSASPDLPTKIRRDIRRALLRAHENPNGQVMLEQVNISGFEPAANDLYRPYARLLEGVWGY